MDKMLNYLLGFSGVTPYAAVFLILLLCGLGLPIPEDITLFVAGLLSYYGNANVWIMIAVSFIGVMLGDSIIFLLGAKYGRRLAKKWFFKRVLSQDRMDFVAAKLKKSGNKIIFAARFMPGLRAPVYFTCGTLHVPFRVFFFFDGMAALISVPLIVYSVYYFGSEVDRIIRIIKRAQFGIVGLIVVVVLMMVLKWWLGRRRQKV